MHVNHAHWKTMHLELVLSLFMQDFPGIHHWKRADLFTSSLFLFLLGLLRHVAS